MTFLTPIAALVTAAVTLPVVVLLYFLKLRRQEVSVSSTLLWNKAIHDLQVNTPFQKLRKNLLLLLQLLLLAAIILAIARPALQTLPPAGQRTVILIDHSASMNARDLPDQPSRLEQARQIATRLVESLDLADDQATSGIMLVAFAEHARVLQPFSRDKSRLRAAIEQIRPTDQRSHLDTALALIEPYTHPTPGVPGVPDTPGIPPAAGDNAPLAVYLLSDGQLHQQALSVNGHLDLRFIRIPDPAAASEPDNLGFVSFAARRDERDPHRVHLFANLANCAKIAVTANIQLAIDDQLQKIIPATIPPATDRLTPGQASIQLAVNIPNDAIITLTHDHADALAADNTVSAVLPAPTRLRLLLVTRGNPFLEQALRAAGDHELVIQIPGGYELTRPAPRSQTRDQGFDMIVFDRYAPQDIPAVNSLYFAAAPPVENLDLIDDDSQPARHVVLDWSRDHPVMRHVSLDNLVISHPRQLALPQSAKTLATGSAGPLIADMRHENRRHLVVAFDCLDSNWPMQTGFPVFITNAVNDLAAAGRGNLAMHYHTGDGLVIPADAEDAAGFTWQGPAVLTATTQNRAAALSPFQTAGLYHSPNAPRPYGHLAVNLLDLIESNLQPVSELKLQIDNKPVAADSRTEIRREIWHWFIAFALTLAMIEWLIYTRRMHL